MLEITLEVLDLNPRFFIYNLLASLSFSLPIKKIHLMIRAQWFWESTGTAYGKVYCYVKDADHIYVYGATVFLLCTPSH